MLGFLGIPIALRHAVAGMAGDYVAVVPVLLGGAAIAPKVSYRRFDCFLLMIPVYGVVFMATFAWRLSYLPYRDWPLRADERARQALEGQSVAEPVVG